MATLKGSFGCAMDPSSPIHTLILGTQPSDASLDGNRYYDTHTNAMWHIIGDALGWRRGWLDSRGRGPTASITRSLLHETTLESYDEAIKQLTSRGYALWDVLKESERAGSLDGDIKNAQPADIRGLVEQNPSITKICLASGGTTATFFKRHFKSWLSEEGAFKFADDPTTQNFAWPRPKTPSASSLADASAKRPIEIVIMESVSPAYVPRTSYGRKQMAKRSQAYQEAGLPHLTRRASAYAWKRQQWFDQCFYRELSFEERAKRFGDREGDFVEEEEEDGAQVRAVD